jgi:hypothetical protein
VESPPIQKLPVEQSQKATDDRRAIRVPPADPLTQQKPLYCSQEQFDPVVSFIENERQKRELTAPPRVEELKQSQKPQAAMPRVTVLLVTQRAPPSLELRQPRKVQCRNVVDVVTVWRVVKF